MLRRFENLLGNYSPFGTLILRVALGTVFLAHGYAAAFVYTPAGLAGFFGMIGIPLPYLSAWGLLLVHLVGGTMILAGLFTRLNGLLHFFVMAVAAVAAHGSQGFFQSAIILDAAKNSAIVGGYEFTLMLSLAALSLGFTGGGAFALDNLLRKGLPRHAGSASGAG